jgi:hypothetical protein
LASLLVTGAAADRAGMLASISVRCRKVEHDVSPRG